MRLTHSSPYATFSTPHYFLDNPNNLYIDCWWYINVPDGEEVHLTIEDMQTENEQLRIYDYLHSRSSSTYLVSHLNGSLRTSTDVISSRGTLTLYHDDVSPSTNNGRGLLFEARILGEFYL